MLQGTRVGREVGQEPRPRVLLRPSPPPALCCCPRCGKRLPPSVLRWEVIRRLLASTRIAGSSTTRERRCLEIMAVLFPETAPDPAVVRGGRKKAKARKHRYCRLGAKHR